MKQGLAHSTVKGVSEIKDAFDIEIPIEEDIKKAWRKGMTVKHIAKRFGGSAQYIYNLCRGLKRSNDLNRFGKIIIKDYGKGRNKFIPKKD